MSSNAVRNFRKLLRNKYTFLRACDIHVGKCGPNRLNAHLDFYYNTTEESNKIANILETLKNYLDTEDTLTYHYKVLNRYTFTFPLNKINSLSALILLL